MTGRDPYTALGVQQGAPVTEIKTAYRKRARVLHPDVNRTDPDADEKFKELVAAYELLLDPLRRSAYDRSRNGFGAPSWDYRSEGRRQVRWRGPPKPPPQSWTGTRVVGLQERTGPRRGRRGRGPVLHGIVMSPDLRRMATHRGETVGLWDPGSGRPIAQTGREEVGVQWLGFSPDGQLLITHGVRGTVLWDAATGRHVDRLNLDGPRFLCFSADGRLLATAVNTLVQVSDVASGHELAQFAHGASVQGIALSSDGQRLAAGADRTAHVWDVRSGRELARLPHHKSPVNVRFSPDGRLLATSTTVARSMWTPSDVHLWDVEGGDELARFQHQCWIDQMVFSPDATRLATDSNGTLRLWDLSRLRELAEVRHVSSEVLFSGDGAWLTAAGGPYLYVWDAATGHQVACLSHAGDVRSVAVDPDGRRIGTAGSQAPEHPAGPAPAMAQFWLRGDGLGPERHGRI